MGTLFEPTILSQDNHEIILSNVLRLELGGISLVFTRFLEMFIYVTEEAKKF